MRPLLVNPHSSNCGLDTLAGIGRAPRQSEHVGVPGFGVRTQRVTDDGGTVETPFHDRPGGGRERLPVLADEAPIQDHRRERW